MRAGEEAKMSSGAVLPEFSMGSIHSSVMGAIDSYNTTSQTFYELARTTESNMNAMFFGSENGKAYMDDFCYRQADADLMGGGGVMPGSNNALYTGKNNYSSIFGGDITAITNQEFSEHFGRGVLPKEEPPPAPAPPEPARHRRLRRPLPRRSLKRSRSQSR